MSERYENPPPEPSADPEGPGYPTGPLPAAPAPIGVGRLDRPAVGWTEIAVGAVAYLVLQIGLAVPLILFYRDRGQVPVVGRTFAGPRPRTRPRPVLRAPLGG